MDGVAGADDEGDGYAKQPSGKLLEWDPEQSKDPNRWGLVVPHLDAGGPPLPLVEMDPGLYCKLEGAQEMVLQMLNCHDGAAVSRSCEHGSYAEYGYAQKLVHASGNKSCMAIHIENPFLCSACFMCLLGMKVAKMENLTVLKITSRAGLREQDIIPGLRMLAAKKRGQYKLRLLLEMNMNESEFTGLVKKYGFSAMSQLQQPRRLEFPGAAPFREYKPLISRTIRPRGWDRGTYAYFSEKRMKIERIGMLVKARYDKCPADQEAERQRLSLEEDE